MMDMGEEGGASVAWADSMDLEAWMKEHAPDDLWRMGRIGGRASRYWWKGRPSWSACRNRGSFWSRDCSQKKTWSVPVSPEKAIGSRLERTRREYLLGELANRGFLPGYGFPTGVVPLITTTMEERAQREQARSEREEGDRVQRAGFPSRDLTLAIRDYAPGTDTVLDGRVYRSGGVTLNWHIPPGLTGQPEVQSLRWFWQCKVCLGNGTRPTRPDACPHCGQRDLSQLQRKQYLEPAGFAVDIRDKPDNDISTPQYIPVRDPLISLEGVEWIALPAPELGRFRATRQGSLFHRTDGLFGEGYALCLHCRCCGRLCAPLVRQMFLRHRRAPRTVIVSDLRGAVHDPFP